MVKINNLLADDYILLENSHQKIKEGYFSSSQIIWETLGDIDHSKIRGLGCSLHHQFNRLYPLVDLQIVKIRYKVGQKEQRMVRRIYPEIFRDQAVLHIKNYMQNHVTPQQPLRVAKMQNELKAIGNFNSVDLAHYINVTSDTLLKRLDKDLTDNNKDYLIALVTGIFHLANSFSISLEAVYEDLIKKEIESVAVGNNYTIDKDSFRYKRPKI